MKRFLLQLLLVAPVLSFAQSNFKTGYIVTNSRDTLRGYVDFRERSVSAESVNFKASLNGNTQNYNLENCMGYGIDGVTQHRRYVVNISRSEVEISKLSTGPDLSVKRDMVFLKVLQEGKNVALFSYVDGLKERFYIMDKEEQEPVELIRNLYLSEERSNMVAEDNKYIRQLLAQIKKNDIPFSEGEMLILRYTERSILKVVSAINHQQPVSSKYKGSRFFAGAGINLSKATYSGGHPLASEGAKSKMSYMPMLNAGIDVFVNPAIGKLIFRAELSLMMDKYEVISSDKGNDIFEWKHSFTRSSVALTPQVIYNFYHTDELKFYAGLGLDLNFSRVSNNKTSRMNKTTRDITVVEEEVIFEMFNYSFPFRIGAVLNKKIEISAGYRPAAAVTNYTNFNIAIQRVQIGVNYLFGKH